MKKSFFSERDVGRKNEIITSALRIIDEGGIKSLTVARLAKEVGFVESALYRHFKSKKELIGFILDDTLLEAKRQFSEVEKNMTDVEDGLNKLLELHLEFLEQYPGIFRIIYSDEIHLGESSLLEKLELLTAEIINFIKKTIEEGIKHHKLKKDVDPDIAAIHFLGIIYTAFSYWTIKKREISLMKIGEKLLEQYLQGLVEGDKGD